MASEREGVWPETGTAGIMRRCHMTGGGGWRRLTGQTGRRHQPQEQVEWAPYAAAIRSVERRRRLEELLTADGSVADVVAACLRSPLYATRFHEGLGTLYTAEYRPAEGGARYHWPGLTWEHSLGRLGSDGFRSGSAPREQVAEAAYPPNRATSAWPAHPVNSL
jgi:hypothetical protein